MGASSDFLKGVEDERAGVLIERGLPASILMVDAFGRFPKHSYFVAAAFNIRERYMGVTHYKRTRKSNCYSAGTAGAFKYVGSGLVRSEAGPSASGYNKGKELLREVDGIGFALAFNFNRVHVLYEGKCCDQVSADHLACACG